jgi:membrane fusion protein (multidrug efflux system)
MASPFSRTLRSLEADHPRRNLFTFLLVLAFLAAWALWFTLAKVSVYAATGAARLEVSQEQHAVGAPVSGRVVQANVEVGRRVDAGEVLFELDAEVERLAMAQEEVRLAPAMAQIAALKQERLAQEQALLDERRTALSGIAELEARARQAASASTFASEEATRISALHGRGLVSELEALRARNAAREAADQAESASFAVERARGDVNVREQDRRARIARLQQEITQLEGTIAETTARTSSLRYDVERRAVRAPIAGTLAEVASLKPGSVVSEGDVLFTIVPAGELKVVAFLTPAAAIGRVQPGQPARVRLEAFPWTQYGSAAARVTHVAGEPRDGQVRVELALETTTALGVPVQHGLPAEVDIEVERISPAALVLRTVASRTRLLASQP